MDPFARVPSFKKLVPHPRLWRGILVELFLPDFRVITGSEKRGQSGSHHKSAPRSTMDLASSPQVTTIKRSFAELATIMIICLPSPYIRILKKNELAVFSTLLHLSSQQCPIEYQTLFLDRILRHVLAKQPNIIQNVCLKRRRLREEILLLFCVSKILSCQTMNEIFTFS